MHTSIQYMKKIAFQILGEKINTSINGDKIAKGKDVEFVPHTML